MKYQSEYRNRDIVDQLVKLINQIASKKHTIMEICGGQTHAILKYGLDELLEKSIELLHGPGCPVCVTPISIIDQAIELSFRNDVIVCSFGDMLRVPGSKENFLSARAKGANIRTVYSPLDAVQFAKNEPSKEIVFFAIGFETTTAVNVVAVEMANKLKIPNFSMLTSQFLVPPAISVILEEKHNIVEAFLAAGHVCAVMGFSEYEPLSEKYKAPIIITGFEPVDILQGIYASVKQLEKGVAKVENKYSRVVNREGNKKVKELINEYFEVYDKQWRGIGVMPKSGLRLCKKYSKFDAQKRFGFSEEVENNIESSEECIAGLILQGVKKPKDCKAFGVKCVPENPLGASMVSAEGVCAAYYNYKKEEVI